MIPVRRENYEEEMFKMLDLPNKTIPKSKDKKRFKSNFEGITCLVT